jgi:hypothetical protein
MSDREFSHIQIFQHSGKAIPLFMTGHKNCLQADYLLEPGRRLIKKEFTGLRSHKVRETLGYIIYVSVSTLYDVLTATTSPNDAFLRTYPRR